MAEAMRAVSSGQRRLEAGSSCAISGCWAAPAPAPTELSGSSSARVASPRRHDQAVPALRAAPRSGVRLGRSLRGCRRALIAGGATPNRGRGLRSPSGEVEPRCPNGEDEMRCPNGEVGAALPEQRGRAAFPRTWSYAAFPSVGPSGAHSPLGGRNGVQHWTYAIRLQVVPELKDTADVQPFRSLVLV